MTAREVNATIFAAIKTASRALVKQLGGGEAASLVCRYNPTAISDACSYSRPDRTLPVDVVLDMELCAGEPFITRTMAGAQGYALVPLPSAAGPEAQAIAAVMADAASLGADFAAAMSDARISPAERQGIKDRLLALHAASAQAVAVLDSASERERA